MSLSPYERRVFTLTIVFTIVLPALAALTLGILIALGVVPT